MKSKKILTILLSLAIMFTFMPAMAFAATETANGSWDDTFTEFTPTGEGAVTAVKSAVTSDTTNKWQSVATWSDGTTTKTDTAYWYDLTGAKVTVNGADDAGNIDLAAYNTLIDNKEVTVKAVVDKTVASDAVAGWDFKVSGSKIENLVGNQKVTLAITKSVKTDQKGKTAGTVAELPALLNADSLSVTLNVRGSAAKPTAFTWIVDGDKENLYASENKLRYDGAEHTISLPTFDGYTVSYEVYDNVAATWKAVDTAGIVVQDVKTYDTYRASYKKDGKIVPLTINGTATSYSELTPVVEAAWLPEFTFVKEDDNHTYTVVEGQDYDLYDFIEVIPSTKSGANEKRTAANKAATTANTALLKEFFKDYYGLTATAGTVNTNKLTIKVGDYALAKAKKLTDADAKYTQMLANFGIDTLAELQAGFNKPTPVSQITVVPASTDYEVTFTKAITSKTFKKSKTTKKGALKKNQTIQFTAEAANGTAVTYKLVGVNTSKITINKSTGKVTLKKGLAKGTYKFKVKAYCYGYLSGVKTQFSENQAVTIKVKK